MTRSTSIMSTTVASHEAGRTAAQRGRWRDAYAAYSEVDAATLGPEDLEPFAEAAWWTGRIEQALELREQAFSAFVAAGDRRGAARVALALHWDHDSRGAFSVSRGWFAKAERLLDDLRDTPEYAHLLLSRGMNGLRVQGDAAEAVADLDRAYELGRAFRDSDVEALALTGKGMALVQSGHVDEGLALLDESTAAAVSGELRPFAAGLVYCCTISSCQDVGDYRRAAEWTEAANRWCDRLDVTGFPGACRIHRAQMLRLRGNWSAAEQQARAACDELHDFDRMVTAEGHYEIGEIRRRRGDFAAALASYRTADELGRDPQPGVALLRLAEGKVDAALHGVRRALDALTAPLSRVQVLPALVEIAIAAGDAPAARSGRAELRTIVDAYTIDNAPAPAFDAMVHLADGQIQLLEGDWDAAVGSLRRARQEWQKVGAPYEVARARSLLGVAYRRRGDEEGAVAELEAASATFEQLGARLDEERVKELLGRLETRRTFLFTDIVGSTRLLETLGDQKWKKLLARHDQLLRECITENGGEVIKQTGDGFFAAFDHPRSAVVAAIAMQHALEAEVFAPDVRIGVHTGGAFTTGSDLHDYGGQGVHVAARVGAAAGPGEILVSGETAESVRGLFPLSEPREAVLKGFSEPAAVVAVAWR